MASGISKEYSISSKFRLRTAFPSDRTSSSICDRIREKYPPGTAVEVVEFHDQYRDIPAGTKGRVLAVDDTGTIHCEFENGVSLGALWGIDIVKKID